MALSNMTMMETHALMYAFTAGLLPKKPAGLNDIDTHLKNTLNEKDPCY